MLYECLREFTVIEEEALGAGGLHIIWKTGEIRELALVPEATGRKLGKQLVLTLLEEAISPFPRVFALTYNVDFFVSCGFQVVSRTTCPIRWKVHQLSQFSNCDEIAAIHY